MKQRLPLTAAFLALALAASATAATTASASVTRAGRPATAGVGATARTGTAAAMTRAGQVPLGAPAGLPYCVAQAMPAGSQAQAPPTATCYASFAASIRAATLGRVRLPASARPGTVTLAGINAAPAAAATTYVLAIDFQNSNYGGVSLAWYQSAKCGSFYAASMPSGWNDVVSSVIAYNGCATTLFKNASFGAGTFAITRNGSASTLGTFNDQASSQTWCPAYPCGS